MKTIFCFALAAWTAASLRLHAQILPCVSVQCPSNIVAECRGPDGTPVTFTVTATTLCGTNVAVVCTPPSGDAFPPGTNTVSCVATDNRGNTRTCAFTVTVADTTDPELQCPSLLQTPCETSSGARVYYTVTASDDCDPAVAVICTPASGALFRIGTRSVVCTGTDAAGNSAQCSFPVTVTGTCAENPCVAIVCPPNLVTNCAGPGGTPVTFSVTPTNRCPGPVTVTCEPPVGSLFPAGLTTVICTATDRAGNAADCAFTVEVVDETPPVIACPTNIVVEAACVDGAIVTWETAATDNCDVELTVLCEPPTGSLFPLGASIVRCTTTDASGLVAQCGFTVTVENSRPFTATLHRGSEIVLQWVGSGLPQVTTSLVPPVTWRNLNEPVQTNRDERTMVVPLSPNHRFFRLAAAPCAPPRDSDGDGVPDRLDRCPLTPAGLAVDALGCASIQLAGKPEQVAEPGFVLLRDALAALQEHGDAPATADLVARELVLLEEAVDMIRAGHILGAAAPGGVDRFLQAVEGLRGAHAALLTQIAVLERELLAHPPDTHGDGDVTAEDFRILSLGLLADRLAKAVEAADEAGRAFDDLRRAITQVGHVRGHIVAINDAQGFIELADGTRLGLTERQYPEVFAEGMLVSASALQFADGSGLAESITVVEAGPVITPGAFQIRCLHLRIAPTQRFPPFGGPTYTLHYPSAYEHDGTLWLERGMRLAASGSGCDSVFSGGNQLIQHLKIELYYRRTTGGWTTVTLANNLRPNHEPVALPGNMDPAVSGVLTVRGLRRQCPLFGYPEGCSATEEVFVDTYNVRVRMRYAFATAIYSNTFFDLDDSPNENGHRLAQIQSVARSGVLFNVPQVGFQAEGYLATANATTHPTLVNVGLGQNFAVFATDRYDDDGIFFKTGTLGVTNAAALYWPRATGQHQGRNFAYSCALPSLVRDVVAFCPSLPHTLYRLPFAGGWPTWRMSQGNFGGFTHQGAQAFAFDFPAAQNTPIRAARGGVVQNLRESFSVSNWSQAQQQCTAFNHNFVVIRHQDGTTGNYLHMPQNGVLVNVGDRVRRGDLIALVGNTGCSTGPHLHFDVRNGTGNTIPVRFEAFTACPILDLFLPCLPIRECYVPATGNILFSTNEAWNE